MNIISTYSKHLILHETPLHISVKTCMKYVSLLYNVTF